MVVNVVADKEKGGQVLLEYQGSLAWVTLSHPGKLNAITVSMWQALAEIFTTLSAQTDLRCVILRGQDDNFAAGADISEFPQARSDLDSVMHYHRGVLALHCTLLQVASTRSLLKFKVSV